MVDTVRLRGLATYLCQANQPINAAQVHEAAVHIDRLTSELEQARGERRAFWGDFEKLTRDTAILQHIKAGIINQPNHLKEEWHAAKPAAADICTIPESAFPDYWFQWQFKENTGKWVKETNPALSTDCQSGAAQRMAHDAVDTAFRASGSLGS